MGQVFVVSGVVLVVIAALFGLGVIPVAEPVRAMLAAVLGSAGAVEGVIRTSSAGQIVGADLWRDQATIDLSRARGTPHFFTPLHGQVGDRTRRRYCSARWCAGLADARLWPRALLFFGR